MPDLQTFPAADLARRTGDILDAASRTPVAITKHRKPRFVVMSVECYEAMRGQRDQQAYTLDDMPDELKAQMIAALERDLVEKAGPGDR